MPLYKTIVVDGSITVYLWKIEESETQLSERIQLTQHCQSRFDRMKSELHRKGFMSIRHLMAVAGYVDADLYYNQDGKPHLKDGRHISITHSHHFTGIIVSDHKEVGIDVEKQRDKILRIAYKFTPIEEYRTMANSEALIRKLTLVWGAKEALYKIYAQTGLSFLHHINISDFRLSASSTIGEIFYEGKASYYDIDFLEFEGFSCVYAVKKVDGSVI
ncbi:MAG: 4'-phosphopantetheinyl transferase superfamily protein [Flavobacteriaceae bacterium]